MSAPGAVAPALSAEAFERLRRKLMFEACRWDPQNGDASGIAPDAWVLPEPAWREAAALAEALAREAMEAEAELLRRPELQARLGLPRPVRRALAAAAPAPGAARLLRFDFHWTPDGWRISEANADVPGGFIEAGALPRFMAAHRPGCVPAGDPAAAYASALARRAGQGARLALVHATAYVDDAQVMRYLARELEREGLRPLLAAPDHVAWSGGRAFLAGAPVDVLVRFYPAEWLPRLSRSSGWPGFFAGSVTPQSNPGAALLVQSKRFPLVWDALRTPMTAWRALLPETRDPRDAPAGWVLKPVFGRVGEGVGLPGVSAEKDWKAVVRAARRHPEDWAAQRPFHALPMPTAAGPRFGCLGVFTVDGRAAGAYGRLAARPLIDAAAQDVAVLLAPGGSA